MGYFKQLHIDCYEGECVANYIETCYMQPDNPSYVGEVDTEPTEPPENTDGTDRDPNIDMDRE